jgi:iron complex outermembrane receptor protein
LPGDVGFALGGSFRNRTESQCELRNCKPSSGSGIDPSKPESKGKRDITAAFVELHVPITKTLEAQLARYDDYSDFGDTFNPKIAFRWEPIKQLMFRTSYSTGFRAPSLYDINAPQSKLIRVLATMTLCYVPNGKAISPNIKLNVIPNSTVHKGHKKTYNLKNQPQLQQVCSRTDQKFSVLC